MDYKIDWLNGGLDIKEATVEIESVNAILIDKDGKRFRIEFLVRDLNFNESQLMERVLTRLDDFKV